jgi:Tol biopolymer transport system component
LWPDFSPDGRQIAFLRGEAGKWGVLVVPALGGAERQVGSVAMGSPWLRWTPDGRFLVVVERPAERGPASLCLLSLDTGEKRRLTQPPEGSAGDAAGWVAPDGGALLVYRWTSPFLGDLYLVRLGPGYEPHAGAERLTSDNASIAGAAWTPDSREVVFSSRREGTDALWRLAPGSGRPPERLAAVSGDWASYPAIAPRGHRLVYASTVLDTNIWRLELAPGKVPEQWIASTLADESPRYSPDGQRIAFISNRSGQRQIWVSDSSGGSLVQVTNLGPNSLADPHWSPDSRQIGFANAEQGRWHSYVVSASGGMPRRVTTGLNEDRITSWSRDGRWIYVSSQGEMWKAPVGGGGRPVQVTHGGGSRAEESPDGKFLYYTRRAGPPGPGGRGSLWRLPVGGGEEIEVAPSLAPQGGYEITERGVYYLLAAAEGGRAVHFYDFAARSSRLVATLPADKTPFRGAGGFSVSPDGRYLLYTQVDQRGSDLVLVENFR